MAADYIQGQTGNAPLSYYVNDRPGFIPTDRTLKVLSSWQICFINFHCIYTVQVMALFLKGEHSPFVSITIDVAIEWLFEHGYAKKPQDTFNPHETVSEPCLKSHPIAAG